MVNIIWPNQEGTGEEVRTDSIHDDVKKKIINQGKKQYTPIFTAPENFSEIQDIYKILGFPDDKKPVILLFRGQKLETTDRDKFTSFRIDADPIEGRIYKVEEVDRILEVVNKARNIGIAHDQIFEKGFLGSESKTSFKFSEDDPKKYFEAFMEFAAYGGKRNEQRHGEAIDKYWAELLKKFEITENIDTGEYCAIEIKTKFGINDKEYSKIFNNDGLFEYNELKKHSEQKLQEKEITEEKSIYSGKHGFVGKIIDGRLYIKSSKDFDGGLFKKGNGVATIFGDFDVKDIDKITADNIGGIAAQDPRLATAVTAAVRQLQRFKDISDLKNENGVFGDGSLFLREGDVKRTQEGVLKASLGGRGGGKDKQPHSIMSPTSATTTTLDPNDAIISILV
jgi:hypothetical protein